MISISKFYVMSDIHGYFDALLESLKLIDLDSDTKNRLILLGDYVDGGLHSYEVLDKIMELDKRYPKQVITLLGNHDEWFCEWLFENPSYLDNYHISNFGMDTVNSFINSAMYQEIYQSSVERMKAASGSYLKEISLVMGESIRNNILGSEKYSELINWLKGKYETHKKMAYFETESQIFVHAGIDEESGDLWKWGTLPETFTGKYPPTTGRFFKDIISGHVYSDEVARDRSYLGKVFWDEKSHFFIDGNTGKSLIVPVLVYDVETNGYYSFEKEKDQTWKQYRIK